MQHTVETKFFHFRQRNSGGYWIINEDVATNLIIEAINAEDAERKMNEITESYSDYCPCCGVRWPSWANDKDGTKRPTVWGEGIENTEDSIIIYYFDGRKEKVNY